MPLPNPGLLATDRETNGWGEEYFQDVPHSMLSLFQLMTLDSWSLEPFFRWREQMVGFCRVWNSFFKGSRTSYIYIYYIICFFWGWIPYPSCWGISGLTTAFLNSIGEAKTNKHGGVRCLWLEPVWRTEVPWFSHCHFMKRTSQSVADRRGCETGLEWITNKLNPRVDGLLFGFDVGGTSFKGLGFTYRLFFWLYRNVHALFRKKNFVSLPGPASLDLSWPFKSGQVGLQCRV